MCTTRAFFETIVERFSTSSFIILLLRLLALVVVEVVTTLLTLDIRRNVQPQQNRAYSTQ